MSTVWTKGLVNIRLHVVYVQISCCLEGSFLEILYLSSVNDVKFTHKILAVKNNDSCLVVSSSYGVCVSTAVLKNVIYSEYWLLAELIPPLCQ